MSSDMARPAALPQWSLRIFMGSTDPGPLKLFIQFVAAILTR